jgi:hypothetical protein
MERERPMSQPTSDTDRLRVLSGELAARGPCVVGATGGSGTRVVARILREGGMFVGEELNRYEDAVQLGFFSDRWIDRYVGAGGSPPPSLLEEMAADLRAVLAGHLATLPDDAPAWGWKEPRSIYLLPFFAQAMPSLRFLHFIRDGRDMAFSKNQQQLKKHGKAVLGRELRLARTSTRSIALWSRVNEAAADFGEQELGSRYLRVRFEDLCAGPGETVRAIFDFFGLEGDAEAIGEREIRPPDTLGRWRDRRRGVVEALDRTAGDALRRFGYS